MAQFFPRPYKREPITVRVTQEKLETIDRLATYYSISRSEFINQCIDFSLGQLDNTDGEENEEKKRGPDGVELCGKGL